MSNFRIGDVCVGVNLVIEPEYNGMECVIVGPEDIYKWRDRKTGETSMSFGYDVQWADGTLTVQPQHTLRLRRPPSWDKWLYDTSGVDSEREVSLEVSNNGGKTWRAIT